MILKGQVNWVGYESTNYENIKNLRDFPHQLLRVTEHLITFAQCILILLFNRVTLQNHHSPGLYSHKVGEYPWPGVISITPSSIVRAYEMRAG